MQSRSASYDYILVCRRWNDTILGVSCIVILLTLRFFRASRINEDTSRFPKLLTKTINAIWFTTVTARNVIVVLICGGVAAVLDAQDRRPFALTDAVKGGLPPIRVPDFTYTYNDTATNTEKTVSFPEILSVSVGGWNSPRPDLEETLNRGTVLHKRF